MLEPGEKDSGPQIQENYINMFVFLRLETAFQTRETESRSAEKLIVFRGQ